MTKHIILFLLTAFLVGGCKPTPASLTPPPTVTVSPTITPAPEPSVPQTNEHLIVTRDFEHWAVLNADGSLQKYIQVPDIASPPGVSPDGNWLVYGLGSYENEPYDYSLNLLNLDDETSQSVTNLISPDFPENIEPIVKSMSKYDPSLYGEDCTDMRCRGSLVKNELLDSVGISKWSPDGKLLAFAAQIDGPSSEIYIYSMQDKTIHRLTDDLQNVERIEWSPDGKRLLYANNIPGILHVGRTFHVTDLEGRTIEIAQEILAKESEWYMHGWISNDLYLLQTLHPEPGQEHFRQLIVLNAENGQTSEIWPYPTDEVVIDTINQRIVLSFIQYSFDDPIPDAPEDGTYFVSTNGDRKKISDKVFSLIPSSVQILGIEYEVRDAYHIISDGSIKRIGAGVWGFVSSSSPDKKWFFLEQEEHEERYGFSLYDDTYQRIKSWTLNEEVVNASWRPDSLGIFLFTENDVYYLDIPDGEPRLLDVEIPPIFEDCNDIACLWPSFAWRP